MSNTTEEAVDLQVRRRTEIAEGVVHLVLEDPRGVTLPPWEPGAHVDLLLPTGLNRQYSLCGDPRQADRYEVAVLDEPGSRGGSRFVCRELGEGDIVGVRGPRSHFPLVPSPRYLFIAGGIGITPILTMLRQADRDGADWGLLYGGRTRASMAFLDRLGTRADRVAVVPQDECGLLDLQGLLAEPRPDTVVYCCGPESLLAAVEAQMTEWPDGALHLERFAPRPVGEPVRSGEFEVVLERSGLSLTVPPDKSILEVIGEAGVPTLSACGEGTCGTCETAVLAGVPDHRDSVLDEQERAANDYMMICTSRSCSPRLVLEL